MVQIISEHRPWRSYGIAMAGVILAAWLVLLGWSVTPYAGLLHHGQIEEEAVAAALRWSAFLAGWTLMVTAMMLPGSLPAIKSLVGAAVNARPGRLLGGYVAGYLAVWLVFGASLYLGDTLLHEVVEASQAHETAERLIPAALLLGAGLYQFTPLKRRCQQKNTHAHVPQGSTRAAALGLGLRAGLLCTGTCGAIMLVMFALGGGFSLVWMLALTGITAAERTTTGGRYLGPALGVALVAWALLRLAG